MLVDSRVLLYIIASVDGFTTNIPGFLAFFRPFESLGLRIIVSSKDSCEEFALNDIINVMQRKANSEPDMIAQSRSNSFVNQLVMAGLNKSL